MKKLYTVFIIDGDFIDAGDGFTDRIRFDRLSINEVMKLLELSVDDGHDFVIREYAGQNAEQHSTE